MTSLTFSLSRALAPTIAPGRRDRHHRARSSRERRAVDAARGRAWRGDPDGADAHRRRTRSTGRISNRSSARAQSCSPSARHRTRSARSRTSRARPRSRTHTAHASSSMRWRTCRTRSSMSSAMGCDFLACSTYKFYGPHLGVLYGRHELLAELDCAKLAPAPAHAPDRWETGTLNFEALAGTTAAIDFLASLGGSPEFGVDDARRAKLARAYHALHDAQCASLRGTLARPRVNSRRRASRRAAQRCATLADGLLYRKGRRLAHGRHAPRKRSRRLRAERKFLRGNHRGAARSRRLGLGARRFCVLHNRRRGRAPGERRACDLELLSSTA